MNSDLKKHDYYEISLKDLFGYLLSKWLVIIAFMVIGASVLCGISKIMSDKKAPAAITQSDIDDARNALSEEQAAQVEYFYSQYLSYVAYRFSVQDYVSDSLYSGDDFKNNIIKSTMYYVKSDINNVSSFFINLSLGVEEQARIAWILKEDDFASGDIFKRVSITESLNDSTNVVVNDSEGQSTGGAIIKVDVVAQDRGKADEVTDIISGAFSEIADDLKNVDENIKLSEIGVVYSSNLAQFITERQSYAFNLLSNASNQIIALQVNYIDRLSSKEQAYYNMLKNRDEIIAAPKGRSLKRSIIIGAVLGLVISLVVLVLIYLFNGKIKTIRELTVKHGLEAPYAVYRKGKRVRLFGGIIRRCYEMDLSDESVRKDMVASDIGIKLEKCGCDHAYLVCSKATAWESEVADNIKGILHDSDMNITLEIGNPLSDPAQLRKFSQAKTVLVMAQLKKTDRDAFETIMQLCRRYELNVMGAVVLEEF